MAPHRSLPAGDRDQPGRRWPRARRPRRSAGSGRRCRRRRPPISARRSGAPRRRPPPSGAEHVHRGRAGRVRSRDADLDLHGPVGPGGPGAQDVAAAVQRDGDPLAGQEAGRRSVTVPPALTGRVAGSLGRRRRRRRPGPPVRSAPADGAGGGPAAEPAGPARRRRCRSAPADGGAAGARSRTGPRRRRSPPGGPGEAVVLQLVDEGDAGAVAGRVLEPAVDGLAPGDVVGAEETVSPGASVASSSPAGGRVVASRTEYGTCRRRPRRRARRAGSWGRG